MSIHDEARRAAEAVYDARILDLEGQVEAATSANTDLAARLTAATAEGERLRRELAEVRLQIAPPGWKPLHVTTFARDDGWTLQSESQQNDNSFNTPKNVIFGDGLTLLGRREALGGKPYTSADALGRHIRMPNYFYMEVTATLPTEYGMWPCPGWVRPLTGGDSGEIDLSETWFFDWERTGAMTWATIWENYKTKQKANAGLLYSALPASDPAAPHTYTAIKTPGRIEILVDGVRVYCWERGAKYSASKRISPLPAWYDSVYEIPGREWYPRITLQIGGSNAREPLADWQESRMVVHSMRIFSQA